MSGNTQRLGSGYQVPSPRQNYSNTNEASVSGRNASAQDTIPSSSYKPSGQPINDAVTSAFHKSDSAVSPELIQLITESVIQQLQSHQQNVIPSAPPVQPPQSAPISNIDDDSSIQDSPHINRASVYTPPSPNRPLDPTQETDTAPRMSASTAFNSHGYNTARRRDISPFSRSSYEEAILSDSDSNSARISKPSNPRSTSTDSDTTVLEKHWGRLFDDSGQRTDKLIQFLKGIANHLIEEVEPRHSLVITPDKMQTFYENTKLDDLKELYPWKLVFDDKTSSISRLLRDESIRVQHHLVQPSPDARPDIPGLTPDGFATWMTLLIRAHPDHEYERLAKVLRVMAINHPDERKQRFPAGLSRRLLPVIGDDKIASNLATLMATHCKVHISSRHNSTATSTGQMHDTQSPASPRKSEAPPPPTVEEVPDEDTLNSSATVSKDDTSAKPITSRSKPTSTKVESNKAASVTSIEDEEHDSSTSNAPIERERKPYVAQVGAGKNHDLSGSGDESQSRPAMLSSDYDLRRTKSIADPQRPRVPPPISIHQSPQGYPQDGPDSGRSRRDRVGEQTTTSTHRSRSNSAYAAQPHPFRRTRSNSTYTNDVGPKYHAKRSPSMSKNGNDFQGQRATAPDLTYGSYSSTTSGTYIPPVNYQQQPSEPFTRQVHDQRNDPRLFEREKSRERERDQNLRSTRSRAESRTYYDDDSREGRQLHPTISNGSYTNNAYQFPPSAYRDQR